MFPVLKHRHFANRVFDSAGHVTRLVQEVWDGFVTRKEEITRIAARDWAVP